MKYIGKQIVHCTIPGHGIHRDSDMNGASDLCNKAICMFGSTGNIVEKNKGHFIEVLGRPIVISLSSKVI